MVNLSAVKLCWRPHSHNEPSLDKILPPLLISVEQTDSKALRCIYQLCNEKNKDNRIPMLCHNGWDVLSPLIKCLHCKEKETVRQLALLTLANLSIPMENKAIMALGHLSQEILSVLYKIIHEEAPEAYLACICLVNLSFLGDAIEPLFFFSFSNSCNNTSTSLGHEFSGYHIMEQIIQKCGVLPGTQSPESEAVRWLYVLIKNITNTKRICSTIARTKIPFHIIRLLNSTQQPLLKWTSGSIEDSSLKILLNLSKWKESKEQLIQCNTSQVIQPFVGKEGIHGYRASVIQLSLTS